MNMRYWRIRKCVFVIGWLFNFLMLVLLINAIYGPVTKNETTTAHEKYPEEINYLESKKPGLKYILQWTRADTVPFQYMGVGQQGFIDRKCPYTNCFVTANRNFLRDYTKFDAIAFAGPQVRRYLKSKLPRKRSLHQKYVFASIESPAYYPVCQKYLDDFFNWTWTYKTDSDVRWGYLAIRDMEGKVIGPNKVMHWMKHEEMLPASNELKKILRGKNKPVAWFASNCRAINNRQIFVSNLYKELFYNYGMTIDIYGKCGILKCTDELVCNEMIKQNYFFYLSFENAFSEDYVTEKLARALANYAVPVVYGGANYSRFMPDGAYLDARKLGVKKLAAKMYEIMNDFDQYADYFRWTNHYTYHRRDVEVDTNSYCAICTILNDERKVKQVSVYKDFRNWWNNKGSCAR